MRKGNMIKAIPLTDIVEFTIKKEAVTQKELNIIYAYGFFLIEYFTQDNHIYYRFRRNLYEQI